MTHDEQIRHDLDYVAAAVRRQDRPVGTPAIYFLWAILVPIGFALPDFLPHLAGVHLIRPLLWSGLMMLAAYAALQLLPLPYIWTISGIAIALSLVWAGIVARQARHAGNAQ